MKLFLLVWEFEQIDRECEWTHFVSKEYPTPLEINKIIRDFMRDNHEETPQDYDIQNHWCSSIETVDGYKVTLSK